MPLVTIDEITYKKLRTLAFEKNTTQKALVEEAVNKVFK